MGLFSWASHSFKKSKKLRQLQFDIVPPNEDLSISDSFKKILKTGKNKDQALDNFLDLCESDDGVIKVMENYDLTRDDLKEIYVLLEINGLGQWVKGHYAALSTIAYLEPLLFYVEATQQNISLREITYVLLEYWEGRIPQGELIKMMQE